MLSTLDERFAKDTCFSAKNSGYSYNCVSLYPNVAKVWKIIKNIESMLIIKDIIILPWW